MDLVSDPAVARTPVAEQEAPPQFIRVSQKHAMDGRIAESSTLGRFDLSGMSIDWPLPCSNLNPIRIGVPLTPWHP
jgi:hypothetical protein